MGRKTISAGLSVVCAAFTILAAGCSQPAVTGMTDARARANAAALVGLISLVLGGLAFARSGRVGATIALGLGFIGAILSVIHLTGSTGFGTGGGRLGAIVGRVLALIGIFLGGLALARNRSSRSND